MNKFALLIMLGLTIPFACHAAPLFYCHGVNISDSESKLLQELIVEFADTMQCKIDPSCITQWDIKDGEAKYSVAWQQQCGPIIGGVYQLGDQGRGSTFVCQKETGTTKTCCWPLGYDYVKEYVKCKD